MEMQLEQKQERDAGFTLIELLIAIVVVGILTAVAIVGISSLVDSGEGAACQASRDAVSAAEAVYYANNNGTAPASLFVMVGDELVLSGGVTVVAGTPNLMTGQGWTSTYTPAAGTTPSAWTAACP
ncbi:MAG: prepilin-type N-terminal cleavage/methylation domain-containing protein [Acidimicrobiales bacterium]